MPPRASIVNLGPSWKRRGQKGNLDVTKFIQRRAIGRRKAEWKTRSMFTRRQDGFQKSSPTNGYGEESAQQADVFDEMKRLKGSRDEKNMDFELTPAKSEMFHLSWKPVPTQSRAESVGISPDAGQHVVEENAETSVESSSERKERPRLPISRGSMFGRFKT